MQGEQMIPSEIFEAYPDAEGRALLDGIILRDCHDVSFYRIGRSMYGAPLNAMIIGEGRGRVAFFGAHHALEGLTSNILYAFVYTISTLAKTGKGFAGVDARLLLRLCTLYVVPTVNPDGVELVRHGADSSPIGERLLRSFGCDYADWQANGRGVDLNHNYDFRFREYKELESERHILPGKSLYSGEYPESEPESHAVAAFIRALSPSLVISLHSQGEEVYSMPQAQRAEGLGKRFAKLCGYSYGIPSDTACFGGLCDYTGSVGIPSLTVEVGKGKNPLPIPYSRSCFYRILPGLFTLPTLV